MIDKTIESYRMIEQQNDRYNVTDRKTDGLIGRTNDRAIER